MRSVLDYTTSPILSETLNNNMKHKVCILTTVHFWNDNRVYYKEVLSLKKLGYEVTYVANDCEGRIDSEVKALNIKKNKNTIKRILGFFNTFNIVRKLDCEVVHFQDPELILTGILFKIFTNKKVIYDVHEDYPSQMLTKYYLPRYVRKPLYLAMKFLEWISGKIFDAIIVADQAVYKHFPSEKTTILFNYPSIKKLKDIDKTVGEVEKEYDIIFPGSMAKFTATLVLDMMKMAKDKGVNLKCLLISPFKFSGGKEYVEKTAEKYGIANNLTLMDRIPPYEVPVYLLKTRIGLIPLPDTPKMRSNIPTKMFEYMYYKLPVLTGELPPCGYFMKKDKYGYMVKWDSAEEYTNKILYLLDNANEMIKLGENGHQLVVNQYNWELEEIKLDNIYKRLLAI